MRYPQYTLTPSHVHTHVSVRRTLERAKQELSIRSVRVWANDEQLGYWLLLGHELPPSLEQFVVDPKYRLSKNHTPQSTIDDR